MASLSPRLLFQLSRQPSLDLAPTPRPPCASSTPPSLLHYSSRFSTPSCAFDTATHFKGGRGSVECGARQKLVRRSGGPALRESATVLADSDSAGEEAERTLDPADEDTSDVASIASPRVAETEPESDKALNAPSLSSRTIPEEDKNEIRADVSRRIRQFAREGNLAGAIEAFTEMQVKGVGPDIMAATALIDCCVRCGEIARAERAFASLFTPHQQRPAPSATRVSSLKPDAVVVGVLLRAYGKKKPPQWTKIQQLLAQMEADFGLQPSAAIFNELVDICARDNEVERGMQLLERMSEAGVEPDEFTFAAVKRRKTLRAHFKKLFVA